MAKHPIADELMRSWLEPLRRREIRRDFRKYAGAAMTCKRDLIAATSALGTFRGPVLVAWDTGGKMMPSEHGRRLTDAFPNARLVEIEDAYTLVPLDQPAVLSAHIRQFLATN
jgi:pimeloyl-ACP methyl ester carboxylesterase